MDLGIVLRPTLHVTQKGPLISHLQNQEMQSFMLFPCIHSASVLDCSQGNHPLRISELLIWKVGHRAELHPYWEIRCHQLFRIGI